MPSSEKKIFLRRETMTMQGIHCKPLTFAVAVYAPTFSLPATPIYLAARQEAPEITPCKTVSPLQQAGILSAGARILRHIAQARAEILTRAADGRDTPGCAKHPVGRPWNS